ncbi:MAG: nicotinate phosphoribosyltransferase, partial [Clostridia bacterium]|nr:nicotinate phosphoribosyltransferase [Clostridia bacterium]
VIDDSAPYEIFDPEHTWKRKTVTNFTAKPLAVRVFDNGECVYDCPTVKESAEYCKEQVATLWDEVKRFEKPHTYYVDLTQDLWDLRANMLKGDKK